MNDHITREQFWIEFFGNFGRDFLVNGGRQFTDNPSEIIQFIKRCTENKRPAFISVQPEYAQSKPFGIEKLFFDFDYGKKSDKLSDEEIKVKKLEMSQEVKEFLKRLDTLNIRPLVVGTNKGYHVYVYFDRVYQIDSKVQLWKDVYGQLTTTLLGDNSSYADHNVMRDIVRLCRIPLSTHEASGKECCILNNKLEPDKVRSIEYYKLYGLKQVDIEQAIKKVKSAKKITIAHQVPQPMGNYQGNVRPCFRKAMSVGEMCHAQRLALLLEAYCSGHKDADRLIDIFRSFNDFDESTTAYQVQYFLDNTACKGEVRPYKCITIQSKGWCIGEQCPLFKAVKDQPS
jgi:hypothetical protein